MIDLTVITPTVLDRGHLLAELHASLAAQTEPVAWSVMYDTNGEGPAAMRNALVAAVSTEWVFPLDDDDLVDADHFETLAPHLTDDVDVVWTSPRVPYDAELEEWLSHPVDVWQMDRSNAIAGAAAVRRSAWIDAGGQCPDDENEDHGLWLRLRNAGKTFRQVHAQTWTYRLDPEWSHRSRR